MFPNEALRNFIQDEHRPRMSGADFLEGEVAVFLALCAKGLSIMGASPLRLAQCEMRIIGAFKRQCIAVHGWCFLPDCYAVVAQAENASGAAESIKRFHGKLSAQFNAEDRAPRRVVWSKFQTRLLADESALYAALNALHHEPVRREYVQRWQDWPFSSARFYLERLGREETVRIWRQYPCDDGVFFDAMHGSKQSTQ
ncbi:hypothetical protein JXA32_15605 [Candidatus Sumerlaeota bacterium]|nr:hypothetical protein [Candidatus Sumerlaeota bacterium]